MKYPGNIRRIFLILCIAAWCGALAATHIPMPTMPHSTSDKTLHFVGYFFLTGIFLLTLRVYRVKYLRRWIIVICVMLAYAAADELTQPLVGRGCELNDFFADAIGMATAIGLDILYFWWSKHKTS